jgi:hypothetical protein
VDEPTDWVKDSNQRATCQKPPLTDAEDGEAHDREFDRISEPASENDAACVARMSLLV